ncbi:hypothetical protein BAE44_0005105, partial [Dichanthelium oligosanthes]
LATFFAHRIQPLKARAHPMHRYSSHNDLTRESSEEISRSEALVCIGSIMDRVKMVVTFIGHPPPFMEELRPYLVRSVRPYDARCFPLLTPLMSMRSDVTTSLVSIFYGRHPTLGIPKVVDFLVECRREQ